jgi:hypothetical protein
MDHGKSKNGYYILLEIKEPLNANTDS